MKLTFSHSLERLTLFNDDGVIMRNIWAASHVRNELDKSRPDASSLPDVVYSFNADRSTGKPYMPRPFPLGIWSITSHEPTTEKWLQPVKLVTDAHQVLPIWALTGAGLYDHATTDMTDVWGYAIHYCNGSVHTDGCIGIKDLGDMLWLVAQIESYPMALEVIA